MKLLLVTLILFSIPAFSQASCRGYSCGLALLFTILPPDSVVYEEGRVEQISLPLIVPKFDVNDILTNRRITSEYLKGDLSFLIFVDIYNFDAAPYWPPLELPPGVSAEPGYETKRSLSVLQKVYEVFSGAGVAVLGILRGPAGWTEDRAKALAEELGLTFPLIHDEGIWEALGVETFSHLILVADREGKVRFRGRLDDPIICGLGLDCSHLMPYLCGHPDP